ncbi:MAG: hypothetical protein IPN36_10990, partial [Bacteroidetes bacterium]|nr:hypothetical protein [Bacteroidota bacterium]
MKKALLLLIVALISQTANAKIWIVDKDSTNYLPSVQVALDSANVNGGDTIMVFGSATNYGNLIITFPVVLIGEGMNNIYGDNTRFNTIEIYSSDVHISGVISSFVLQCSYAPGDSLGNVIIERCKIQGSISFYGNPCVLTVGCTGPYAMLYDTYIRNNLIEGTISLHSWNTQGAKLIFDTLVFENNIISSGFVRYFYEENLLGCETIIIRHNNFINGPPSVFLGSGNGVLPLNDVEVSENIFYGSNPNNCDSCKFLNNLTFGNGSNDTIITTGVNSGNIIANTTDTIFVNYSGGPFNFNQDFNVHASSPAIGAGIGGDTIGTFGGNYPLGVGEGARLPYLETIHLSNFAYLQSQDFFLNLSARARRNFNDIEILQEIKYSFDSIYPFGQGTTLPFNAGLNVSYSDSIPFSVLDSGLHTITFIARDSKGAYSFPRTYPFNVCTYNEVGADFNLYQSGRDVILDADFKNVLSSL